MVKSKQNFENDATHNRPIITLGKPPIPHEHGAWFILIYPMVISFAVVHSANWAIALCLMLSIVSLYLARNAFGILIRRKHETGIIKWVMIYVVLGGLLGLPVLLHTPISLLAKIIGAVAFLFLIHSIISIIPSRKRMDRSLWGEILGVAALTVTSPTAYIINAGYLDRTALWLWGTCFLYFSSGVFFVKMFLQSARIKGEMSLRDKWAAGKASVLYHLLLMLLLAAVLYALRCYGAIWIAAAFLPVIIRALYGFRRLTNKLPAFTRIGIGEAIYATWFTFAVSIAFRML